MSLTGDVSARVPEAASVMVEKELCRDMVRGRASRVLRLEGAFLISFSSSTSFPIASLYKIRNVSQSCSTELVRDGMDVPT